ncbi:MAG: glycoside hydrolase family 127 protein [Bacteroidales bacterium]|nr:glycoside hydrolase family 127 protein [Bacteroidales bacterium]
MKKFSRLFQFIFIIPATGIFLFSSCSVKPTSDYKITPVTVDRVTLTDSFWAPRIQRDIDITIPAVIQKLYQTGRVQNFINAGKVLSGESLSEEFCTAFPFDDSDVYKQIDAGAYALMYLKNDPRAKTLEYRLDSLIDKISRAQEKDGYLYTARTMNPKEIPELSGKVRFVNEQENSHELYNLGHLFEAACTYHQSTGKKNLLKVAVRSADYLYSVFGKGKLVRYPGHEEIETGLATLYRTTGDPRYMELSRFFLESRGPGGTEYNQAHIKPVNQTEAAGHAVRAMYLYSGMTELGVIESDTAYLSAVKKIWNDITGSKTYVTGGVGSKASNEGFGDPYDLPNHTAYSETCSSIGFILWNERMFRLTGDSKYVDLLEKTLYNAFLSGISISGDHFFYPNPLESWGKKVRPDWYACACCPPNVARMIAMVPGLIYAQSVDRIFVNLYVAGKAELKVADSSFIMGQSTSYPWDGQIRIGINPASPVKTSVLLRIPGWAENQAFISDLYTFTGQTKEKYTIKINGEIIETPLENGYAVINRKWQKGDTILLNLPMPVRTLQANQAMAADRGKVAVQRGPIIYCAEAADHSTSVLTMTIDPKTTFSGVYKPGLLSGIYTLSADISQFSEVPAGGGATAGRPYKISMIPYFAWANREPGEMAVWFATDPRYITRFPEPPGLEAKAKGSASYAYDNSIPYLNDGIDPVNSADRGNNAFRLHPHIGTDEWVAYEFDQPQKLSSVKVYWLEDGSYFLPASWKLSYQKSDGSWAPVNSFSPYLIEKDQYNEVTFVSVITKGLRIEMKLNEAGPGGIIEWKVN